MDRAGRRIAPMLMAAITAALMWLLLLGAWPPANAAAGPLPAPAPGALAP
jgi:hypothetical protein